MTTIDRDTNRGAAAFDRWVFRILPMGCLGIAATCGVVGGPGWSVALGPLPWLISLFVVGLPHGAADLARSRRAWCGTSLAVAWLLYGLAMAGVMVVFMAAPWPTLAVFLALSGWHFGWAHAADDDRVVPGGMLRIASALAHGGVVLGIPLIAWPAETAAAANQLLALTHRGHPRFEAASGAVLTTGLIVAALGLVALGVEVMLTCRRNAAGRRLARLAFETTVFATLGWFTAPLFSVGLSFLVWHGWRQMADLGESVVVHAPRRGAHWHAPSRVSTPLRFHSSSRHGSWLEPHGGSCPRNTRRPTSRSCRSQPTSWSRRRTNCWANSCGPESAMHRGIHSDVTRWSPGPSSSDHRRAATRPWRWHPGVPSEDARDGPRHSTAGR